MKIEGRNAVREAILSGKTIDKVLVRQGSKDKVANDIINLCKAHKIRFQLVDNVTLDRESATKAHQGLIAYVEDFKYSSVQDILAVAKEKNEDHFILILDGIEDPHNLGSIIRVAECLGVHGIIIGKNRACSVNETVVKVSAGATNYMKIAKVTNIHTEIENLKKQNIWVYACELGGDPVEKTNLKGNVAIVIGSEGFGCSKMTKDISDGVVTLQMKGQVNSLNASVATGIILYETLLQRLK